VVACIVILGLLVVAGTGCSREELPGQPVSGMVTVEGVPLRMGTITFKPLSDEAGPKVTLAVREGKFQASADKGPWPGEFQVQIAVTPPDVEAFINKASHEEMAKKAAEPYRNIAKRFGTQSTLRYTVKPDSENRCDFEVAWEGSRK